MKMSMSGVTTLVSSGTGKQNVKYLLNSQDFS